MTGHCEQIHRPSTADWGAWCVTMATASFRQTLKAAAMQPDQTMKTIWHHTHYSCKINCSNHVTVSGNHFKLVTVYFSCHTVYSPLQQEEPISGPRTLIVSVIAKLLTAAVGLEPTPRAEQTSRPCDIGKRCWGNFLLSHLPVKRSRFTSTLRQCCANTNIKPNKTNNLAKLHIIVGPTDWNTFVYFVHFLPKKKSDRNQNDNPEMSCREGDVYVNQCTDTLF